MTTTIAACCPHTTECPKHTKADQAWPENTGSSNQTTRESDRFDTQNMRRGIPINQENGFVITIRIGRNVLVVSTVFSQAEQHPWMQEEIFDDHLRLIEFGVFKANVEIITYTLESNVLGGSPFSPSVSMYLPSAIALILTGVPFFVARNTTDWVIVTPSTTATLTDIELTNFSSL